MAESGTVQKLREIMMKRLMGEDAKKDKSPKEKARVKALKKKVKSFEFPPALVGSTLAAYVREGKMPPTEVIARTFDMKRNR